MLKYGYHEINELAYEEHSKRLAELFKEYVRKADRMTSMTKIRIVRNGTTLGKNYVKSSLARNSKEYIKWTEECLREVLL